MILSDAMYVRETVEPPKIQKEDLLIGNKITKNQLKELFTENQHTWVHYGSKVLQQRNKGVTRCRYGSKIPFPRCFEQRFAHLPGNRINKSDSKKVYRETTEATCKNIYLGAICK